MRTMPVITPLRDADLHNRRYDCFIATVGFETRARYLAELGKITATRKVAPAFADRKVLAFDENRRRYVKADFEVEEVGDEEFFDWSRRLLSEIVSNAEEEVKLCIDISSSSRLRIASLIDAVRTADSDVPLHVDFLYCGATFSPPPRYFEPNVSFGPVLPSYAGWLEEPDLPASLIVGLGYEQDKAVGAIEYINPAEVWTFKPVGHHERYSRAVEKANKQLWDYVPKGRQLIFGVYEPFETLTRLESLTAGVMRSRKVILLPFGPKVFALCCVLVGSLHPEVGVWRVSAGHNENPVDRIPNGRVAGLSASWARKRVSAAIAN